MVQGQSCEQPGPRRHRLPQLPLNHKEFFAVAQRCVFTVRDTALKGVGSPRCREVWLRLPNAWTGSRRDAAFKANFIRPRAVLIAWSTALAFTAGGCSDVAHVRSEADSVPIQTVSGADTELPSLVALAILFLAGNTGSIFLWRYVL